ncbi:F0F1 ATP synthase subunit delta [uncultured Methylophaga sp.]|jgi:F-type H+-transporting ATPase subunit delta|uniref:F0F1 ATP synthase subunit delta n=1 Tax=uncultured Methylophaga sp. TaxID=285271 RepID=UPI0026082907|nr:F0F1 ATP synthase subunit delta [uncultured Methylophaga sp.]
MAEAITIARPYANAVFSLAQEKGELKAWSDLLAVLAQCVSEPEMQSIITSPAVSDEQVVDVLADIAGDSMTTDAKHFLALLAENDRLLLMTEITVLFEALRAEAEKQMTADVISARELSPEQADKISAALKQRLGRDITLNTSIDESLLGGAIIRAGDLVIDGSALGKLNRLANAIN